nr:TetR family transcriptional regulator [Paenibacillus odorifer]
MLLEDRFDKITVKAITEKADISRKTFYLHYVDKYNLLDTIVNKQLEELGVICEQKKEKGFIEGTVIWFNILRNIKLSLRLCLEATAPSHFVNSFSSSSCINSI